MIPPGTALAEVATSPARLRSALHVSLREIAPTDVPFVTPGITVHPLPEWRARFVDGSAPPVPVADRERHDIVASVTIDVQPPLIGRLAESLAAGGISVQSDVALRSALWDAGPTFGTRAQARALMRAGPVPPGHRVNVVICDQGFDAALFPARNFNGGWGTPTRVPGAGHSAHSAMIARCVLDLAPDAILYDCPLIPAVPPGGWARIEDMPAFTSEAVKLLQEIDLTIWLQHVLGIDVGSWVFVHPWALYDRRADTGQVKFATDPQHGVTKLIAHLIARHRVDMVFAAGNCGQFAADRRCGPDDCGPGRSILGANSLAEALTVGAVRVDGTWSGFSSQGPGQPLLGTAKPDVVAPSGFAENYDAGAACTGTSAASGMAAGAVAALRAAFPQRTVSPAAMHAALLASARPIGTDRSRVGTGVIDIEAAAAQL